MTLALFFCFPNVNLNVHALQLPAICDVEMQVKAECFSNSACSFKLSSKQKRVTLRVPLYVIILDAMQGGYRVNDHSVCRLTTSATTLMTDGQQCNLVFW